MLPTVSNPDSLAFRLFKDCDWVQGRGMRGASCEFCSALSMIFDSPEPLWIAWGPGEKRFFFEAELEEPHEVIHIIARHDAVTRKTENGDLRQPMYAASTSNGN